MTNNYFKVFRNQAEADEYLSDNTVWPVIYLTRDTGKVTRVADLPLKYNVAGWTEGASSPVSAENYILSDLPIEWDFYLVEMGATPDESGAIEPLGKLKKNNLFRYSSGEYAPTVGITEAMRQECMGQDLYLAGGVKYCNSGSFNPAEFWETYSAAGKLYTSAGTEISHILRPWETTRTDLSIFLAPPCDLYFVDGVRGDSGMIWKGIFTKPIEWDGIDVSTWKIPRTGISPSPVTTVGGKSRCFFYLYPGDHTYTKGHAGTGNIFSAFVNDLTYPRVNDATKISSSQWARANNPDSTKPVPFAEGSYPAYSLYVSSLEIIHQTKYLVGKFGSGISSNDLCNSEATWTTNGGCKYRYRAQGESWGSWKYGTFSTTPSDICTDTAGTKTGFYDWTTYYYPHEATMESQMAASWAVENGIQPETEFSFGLDTYTYSDISGIPGLLSGKMNCIIRKTRTQVVNSNFSGAPYSATGVPLETELSQRCRMSLFGGCHLAGDIWVYWPGGLEMIGTANSSSTSGITHGEVVEIYTQPDQTKWGPVDTIVSKSAGTWGFEETYQKLPNQNLVGNGYMKSRLSMSPFGLATGASISTYECFYHYQQNNWGTVSGTRYRLSTIFGGPQSNSFCSPRSLNGNYTCSTAARLIGSSSCVLLRAKR